MKKAGVFPCVLLLLLPYGARAKEQQGCASFSQLPLAAQSSISAALGRDLPDYYAHPTGDGFEAANPSQDLATRFDSAGVELRSGNLRWRLAFDGYGYGNAFHAAAITSPHAVLNRIEYRRGQVTEWYINGPAGVEQGFTVNQPPSSHRALVVALRFAGDLATRLEHHGGSLTIRASRGAGALTYSGLMAYDAAGKRLPAWMEMRGAQLLLRVNPVGARYPVTIDPIVQSRLTASDGKKNDKFGTSVAISGNTVVIGSPASAGTGAAYVFVKPVSGWANMTQTGKLVPSDAAGSLGTSVAISGSVIVAGAPSANSQQGVAYVYVKPAGGWKNMKETAQLTGSDVSGQQARLGQSVSISGDTIVAGGYGTNSFEGTAYVFVKPASGWATGTQTARLQASDAASNSYLGVSVSISGNTVVAGASGATIGTNTNQGASYVFVKPPTGWTDMTQTAKLTASDGAMRDQLGNAVAISGNTVVAGALGANQVKGAAYIFVQPGGGWTDMTETAKLTAKDGAAGDNFGSSVAVSGTVALLGAPTALGHLGAAYVFLKPSGGWRTTDQFKIKLTANDGVAGDYFGFSVGISGNTATVGAAFANSFQGKAYVLTQ